MSAPEEKLVEVCRAENVVDAHMLRMALEEAGVRAFIDGELLQGAVGELPLGWGTVPRVMVAQSQLAGAIEVIAKLDEAKSFDTGKDAVDETLHCMACGQVMDETQAQCPNCGWSYTNVGEKQP